MTAPHPGWVDVSRGKHPGRALSVTMWVIAILTSTQSVLNRLGHESASWNVAAYLLAFFLIGYTLARWRVSGAPNSGLIWAVVAYTGVLVLSLIVNHQYGEHAVQIVGLVYLPGLLVLIRSSGASRDQVLRLCLHVSTFIVYGSVLLGALLPGWAYSQNPAAARRLLVFGLNWRLAGLTPHENLLGVTAVVCVILAFALRARFRFATLAVSLAAIGLAESRNAALTLVLIAIVAWLLGGTRIALRAFFGLPLMVLAATQFVPSSDNLQQLGSGAASLNGRTFIFGQVLKHWFDRPLLGHGPLAFQPSSETPFSSYGYLNAHNQLLEALAEGGVLGLVCMTIVIACIIRIGWTHRSERLYLCLALALLVSMSTETFLTLHLYGLSYILVPAFLLMASLMSAGLTTRDPTRAQPPLTPPALRMARYSASYADTTAPGE